MMLNPATIPFVFAAIFAVGMACGYFIARSTQEDDDNG
jgi:hypothetical protein